MTQNNSANNGTPDNAAFKVGGQSPITFDRFIRGLIGLLLIAGLGTALYYLSGVLIPFFVAWMVAYLLYPVVRFLQNNLPQKVQRGFSNSIKYASHDTEQFCQQRHT